MARRRPVGRQLRRGKGHGHHGQGQVLHLGPGADPTAAAQGRNLIAEMIRFPKLLIGAVNGNAIGFGVTTLALCDVVYAVPGATFKTPFMQLELWVTPKQMKCWSAPKSIYSW
ncbi:hypothetical protein BC938DRAFT_470651 [Jimgerdemannia flammicorona]|uniref:ClpP/crotonase-like domain-containing protein n=1 Tax=Jimgerdemannia flammicorona TaxID=994334 RepID=A0A433Q9P3_9FUNG|nr:hypothetical protein BC938DRAFT_470651 [Jimgerdemannia flammicorona]